MPVLVLSNSSLQQYPCRLLLKALRGFLHSPILADEQFTFFLQLDQLAHAPPDAPLDLTAILHIVIQCNVAAGICFWNTATPSHGNWKLAAGQTSTITIPYLDNGSDFDWSGNFGEDGSSCSADATTCTNSGCAAPVGSKAEITLVKKGADTYDVSNIHGKPSLKTLGFLSVITKNANNPYQCANMGGVTPSTGLGASSWKFSPPDDKYIWVSGGSGASCSASSQCPSGQYCGTVYTNGVLSRACGTLTGYWSANQGCILQSSSSIFDCPNQINNGGIVSDIAHLQGCDGATSGSCYQPGADNRCCGCAQWETILGTSLVPAITGDCYNSSPVWTSDVLPTIQWIKAGSPNGYTFPYDDISSTATCVATNSAGYNTLGYTIELCPQGTDLFGSTSGGGSSGGGGNSGGGTAGTCNGVSYTSSQVCDNGHVCPSGQHYCNGSCYDPNSQCCSNGALASAANLCYCAGAGFTSSQYTCSPNNVLCPAGNYQCGGACYQPSLYSCCNGNLTPVVLYFITF
ncbi:hypothetical protein BT69DRAFT_1323406 [Atractiella rhizophila]|nr:hypothetical protein BT69DRAFT_1323406 [Atractiella rhizophila]